MYRQVDRVSIGSPLGPTLANIFIGFHEKGLLSCQNKLEVYFCYVDDTFCLYNSETEVDLFLFPLMLFIHLLDLY